MAEDGGKMNPIERMTEVMARAAEAAEAAVVEHGDAAVDLVLFAARIEAMQVVLVGVLLLPITALAAWFAVKYLRISRQLQKKYFELKDRWGAPDGIMEGVLGCCVGLSACVAGGFCAANLFSLNAWVGMFVPEYWIAMKAMEAVL